MFTRVCLLACFAAGAVHPTLASAQAAEPPAHTEPFQLSFLPGWVKMNLPNVNAWAAADDPTGAKCRVRLEPPETSADRAAALWQQWQRLTSGVQANRPVMSRPVAFRSGRGIEVMQADYAGPVASAPWFYFGLAHADLGLRRIALVGTGTDPACPLAFATVLLKLAPVQASVPAPQAQAQATPAANALGNFYADMNRQEQARNLQRQQDQMMQDRLFQQREFDRQNQQRLFQQRIQDSYRR